MRTGNHPVVRPRPEGISLLQIRKWSDGRLARLAGRGRLALHKHFGNPRRTEVSRTEIRSQRGSQPAVSTFRINLFVVLVIFITAPGATVRQPMCGGSTANRRPAAVMKMT